MENQADAILRGAAAGGMTLDELFGAVEQEWQDQALCAQTDPEAFFPEKAVPPARPNGFAKPARFETSAWSTRSNTTSASVSGVGFRTGSAAA